MTQTVEAVFDGKSFFPSTPILLKPNTRVKIIIEPLLSEKETPSSFLQTAQHLKLDGPADWSENLDAYLYEGKEVDE